MKELKKLAKKIISRKKFLKKRASIIEVQIPFMKNKVKNLDLISGISRLLHNKEDSKYVEAKKQLEDLEEELRDIGNELESIYDDERELRSDIGDF